MSARSSVFACETTPIWRFTSAACRLRRARRRARGRRSARRLSSASRSSWTCRRRSGRAARRTRPRRTSRSSPSTAMSDPYTLRSCSVRIGASPIAENVSARPRLQCASPGGVPERPKGTGCKPVGSAYGGSNPPAPTTFCARRASVQGGATIRVPALLAQLVEHLHGKEGVDGSSPSEGFSENPANRTVDLSMS